MRGIFDKFKNTDGSRRYVGTPNKTIFSIDKNYSLVEVITLLKYQAYSSWETPEALDIILTIGSIRDCLLKDARLEKITDTQVKIRETRNVDINLGKVLRNFELLCETYSLPNPLGSLEGADALQEMKKLVKLDKDFYGNENAFVLTREIYKRKSKELGADFFTDEEIYPLANIQLYDTMILLMLEVVQYDSKALSNQIKEYIFKLRRLVGDKKVFDTRMRNNPSDITLKDIDTSDNLLMLMGQIQSFLDGVAEEFAIPNKLSYETDAKRFWQKLADMFEVLNSVSVVSDVKNTKHVKNVKKDDVNTKSEKSE